jgi:hypothetical protein
MLTFKQWLEETSTIPQLDMKARQAFPHTKKRHNDVGSVNVLNGTFFTPNVPKNELTIDSRTRSRTGNAHSQRIILYRVHYAQPDAPNTVSLPNMEVAVEPIVLNSETARVACDCMDFRFRFANHNHRDDSLAGEPPPAYQPVPGSNRPEANPSHLPGMCKHLMAVVQQLKRDGIVK